MSGGSGGTKATGGAINATGGASTAAGSSAVAGSSASAGARAVAGSSTVAGGGAGGSGGTTGTTSFAGTAGLANLPFVYFVKQANNTSADTGATLDAGTITANATYSTSGNAFKYQAPNYYGTNSNGFIALPTPMTGDFSISAEVTLTNQIKANNACGIGVGFTTGYNPTDLYAYTLMRNSANTVVGCYVSGAGTVSMGSSLSSLTTGTALALSFARVGANVTFSVGPVGGTPATQTLAASSLTDGTTVYGTGSVYPAISFNNVAAKIQNLIIKDQTGTTVYDSASGTLITYIPAALALASPTASMKKGASTTVKVTATAVGGAVSGITAVAADPTIVDVSVTSGSTDSTINLTGLKGGVTTVTVTNTSDTNAATRVKTLTVSVNDYATTDPYGDLASVTYPAVGAAAAYTDGELALTFDAAPTLNAGGSIKIFKLSDGTEVDSVGFAGESQTIMGTALNVGSQLARISGNTVYFTPHIGKLAYGTAYYVGIPTHSITGTLNGTAFNGLSDLSTIATWRFTTRAAPTLSATSVTVDGSQASTANYRTIQGALSGILVNLTNATSVTVNVAAGTYNELLRFAGLAGTAQTIRIAGPAGNAKGDTCVVQWINGNAMNGSTQTRASFYFTGANLILENITLKNNGVRSVVNQAETIYFAGGSAGTTFAAYNSSFISNQDTIQTSGRTWFYKCHIEGNTDFIWGTADASLFEDCTLRVVAEASPTSSYSIVVARTGATIPANGNGTVAKGYVVLNSTVSVDAGMNTYLGRDAGTGSYYDQVSFINVALTGSGTIATGLWNVGTTTPPPYLYLGDGSYVGWKSSGCTFNSVALANTAANTSLSPADLASEFDTRDHILNRVVTVTAGAPSGYQAAAATWDVSTLATGWGAP